MKQEDFNDWLEHPVTQSVFKYWKDSVAGEIEALKDQLLSGVILSDVEQAQIASVHTALTTVVEIEFSEIEDFYIGENEHEGPRQ